MNPEKQNVLARYERDPGDNAVLIDVAAAKLEDLYEDFDKTAPFVRRDLDRDLVDYLIDCAAEIGKVPFRIRFTLTREADGIGHSRVRQSMESYFLYLAEIERRKIHQILRRSWVLLGIGLVFLFLSVSLHHQWLGETPSVTAYVFTEGLTIAAWVSMWNALAIYLIDWFPHRHQVRLFKRLSRAELLFRAETTSAASPLEAAPTADPAPARDRVDAPDSGPPFHSP